MQNKRRLAPVIFIGMSVVLAAVTTSYALSRQKDIYTASLTFQIASAKEKQKADFVKERELLLSDDLLLQTLKDMNVVPVSISPRFRGLDLGQGLRAQNAFAQDIANFRDRIKIRPYPENSALEILVEGEDPAEISKIVSVLFEKFRSWRSSNQAGFDKSAIAADMELSKKRDEFIQAQQSFLAILNNNESQASLLEKRKLIEADIAALKLRYGPKHPSLQEAQKRLEVLISEHPQETQQIAVLREKMELAFQNLDATMRQAMLSENSVPSIPGQEILPLGEVAVQKKPKREALKISLAMLLGLALSILYLNIRSRIRPVIRDVEDLEKAFSILSFDATGERLKNFLPELKLRTDVKLLVVTSTYPRDGRSDFVLTLARMAARTGAKVLILDGDLHEPDLHKKIPPKNHRNLVDYLSGQCALEDVIMRGEEVGMHIIYGTAIPNTALDLVSSEKMKTLMLSLREAYDLVLVRTPVAPQGMDACVLGAIADKILYLVPVNNVLQKQLAQATALFRETANNFIFVLKD